MSVPIMKGITAKEIETTCIKTRVLFAGSDTDVPVLFLHGNTSSATWWEETMLALPEGYFGIAPDQRGFGAADIEKKIDATRGMKDFADDMIALLDHLGIEQTHIVGSSLGGSIVWQLMLDAPQRWLSVTQVAPGSPYGFGGTKGLDGTPLYEDFAGSGGGLTNPEFIKLMVAGDQGTDSQFSPRNVLRALVFKAGFVPHWEDVLVDSTLSTHLGAQDMPGDFISSVNWPGIAPGVFGPSNSLSPKYGLNVAGLIALETKPPVLWVRGSHDLTVSDSAMADPGTLGKMGVISGWPGEDAYPSQPMLRQTRAVLENYKNAGGSFTEIVIEDAAHVPYIDNPDAFNEIFHTHLKNASK